MEGTSGVLVKGSLVGGKRKPGDKDGRVIDGVDVDGKGAIHDGELSEALRLEDHLIGEDRVVFTELIRRGLVHELRFGSDRCEERDSLAVFGLLLSDELAGARDADEESATLRDRGEDEVELAGVGRDPVLALLAEDHGRVRILRDANGLGAQGNKLVRHRQHIDRHRVFRGLLS